MSRRHPGVRPIVENNGKATGGVTGKGFTAGRSGNPGGRPKVSTEFRKRCRDFMDNRGWELLVKLATSKGRDQIHALRFLAEQGYGKPAQSLEIGGDTSLRIILDSNEVRQ